MTEIHINDPQPFEEDLAVEKSLRPNQMDEFIGQKLESKYISEILKNAPNPDNANLFLEFLISKRVQKYMVDKSFEYPIVEGVLPSPEIASFGLSFKEDDTAVKQFGELNPDAIRLMDRSGWK